MLEQNIILTTDSYKASHWKQYEPGTTHVYSYIESRGGRWDRAVFFGLQMFIKAYLLTPVTAEMVDEAEAIWTAHGLPFNREGWDYIVAEHGGRLPVLIKAAPEGSVIPNHNVLATIVNTDPKCFWLTSYLETALLRAIWFPTTVATNSWTCKQLIRKYLEQTSDDPDGQIAFKLHDFGARGVSSRESAAIGGVSHLVNFMGTDTIEGVLAARKYYGEPMAGFSIPAAEHSTISMWGRDREVEAYRHMLTTFAKPGSLVAVVSDTYDLWNAIDKLWGEELRQEVVNSGATVVIRPDSGDPDLVPVDAVIRLAEKFGTTVNAKGYKVLNNVRVIQGDGIDYNTIRAILWGLEKNGFSADNIAFGMGGSLIQMVNRDTLKFAMKCSAACIHGEWRDVFKDPITDPGKRSKRGRLALVKEEGSFKTVPLGGNEDRDLLEPVYQNGVLLRDETFADIRVRANRKG